MPAWLEKFLTITDASLGLQIKLVCIPVVPSLIAMFGAYQLDNAVPPGQYSALLTSAREVALPIYFASVFIALVGCIRIFAKEYQRVRMRLFGY